jgi:3-hydroxyisobutyrate dehydrogenase-like beta-hydroxyacid dehydrogenase
MTGQDFGVAVVGLGQIGAGLASRLVDWPGGLTVYDVRAEAAAPLVEKGARAAAALGEVAAARVISIVVLNDEQVREVVGELLTTVAPGTVIAIHSTIDAETAPELAERGARRGVHVLDVALTGGHFAVLEGRLVAMIGGDEAAHRIAEPVFARWAEHQLHFGPSGSGIRAKLARNMLQFIGYAATGEISRLAEAAGVDLLKLAAAIRHSDAVIGGPSVVMISPTTAAYPADDPLRPIFENTCELGEKDLSHALALGDALGVDLPFGRLGLASLAAALRVPHQLEGSK